MDIGVTTHMMPWKDKFGTLILAHEDDITIGKFSLNLDIVSTSNILIFSSLYDVKFSIVEAFYVPNSAFADLDTQEIVVYSKY